MFRNAVEAAMQFTQPVKNFVVTFGGECSLGLASCVVINPEGWIVTAAHVVKDAIELANADAAARAWEAAREQARNDHSVSAKDRGKRFAAFGKQKNETVRRAGTLWGHNNSILVNVSVLPEIDLAVGQLNPFDPAWVANYPCFKDPNKDFRTGASLCKLGFPFLEIKPTYDEATSSFDIPPEMRTFALFPIDGIFTRNLPIFQGTWPFPLMFVETSSPGLRGQSGGPTFDKNGAIWAIQSQTRHQPLQFSPEVIEKGVKVKEHQFLNVGMGVHAATIIGFLNHLAIKHTMSAD